MYRSAFFISPDGKIFEVNKSHIAFVIENPGLFVWTKDQIRKIYSQHDEPIGLEGKAREEILIQIIQNGWIRIRRYKEYWKITLDWLTDEKRKQINKWVESISDGQYTPVKIMELKTRKELYFPTLHHLCD